MKTLSDGKGPQDHSLFSPASHIRRKRKSSLRIRESGSARSRDMTPNERLFSETPTTWRDCEADARNERKSGR